MISLPGIQVTIVSNSQCCGASLMTGWPGISKLSLDEIASVICNFCLSVAACKIVCDTQVTGML